MGCVGSTEGATPGNSQVKELSHVSTLESGTAVPTDGDVGRRGEIEATAAA